MRGPEISRPFGQLIDEVKDLAFDGVTEVTLLGQNVNSYGRDLTMKLRQEAEKPTDHLLVGELWASDSNRRPRPLFADLLRAVGEVEGIERVRYTSPHPKDLRPETIAAMAEVPEVCEHIHLPLQSGSDRILASMHRGYTAERYLEKLNEARAQIPDLAVTTDIIVGFPGEKKEHFEHLLEFLNRHKFDHVGVFIFSPEEGTAAFHLPNKVSPEVAEARKDNVISVQQNISKEKNQTYVGSKMKILVEQISDNNELIGRSYNFAPEIDGTVILSVKEKIDLKNYIGKFVEANITFADEYDLYGETIKIL